MMIVIPVINQMNKDYLVKFWYKRKIRSRVRISQKFVRPAV
jgi:hypothetical protein